MKPSEAIQYLAAVASDFVRTLPESARAPLAAAVNESLRVLAPLCDETQPDPGAMVNGDGKERGKEGQKREAPGREPRGLA